MIATSEENEFADLTWSPDSQWLAFVETLADRAQLAALALEMADSGRSTATLARDALAVQGHEDLRFEKVPAVAMPKLQHGR